MSHKPLAPELDSLTPDDISRPGLAHLSDARRASDRSETTQNSPNSASKAITGDVGPSRAQSAAIIASIVMVTSVSSMLNGMVTVILPTLGKELNLGLNLLVWPISITALVCGCTLLLAGSICDVVGSRIMYLLGAILQTGFILGTGLSQTGFQLIFMRGLTGGAISLTLPSAVSIITTSFSGKQRNMAFAALGAGQPGGFVIGLVLGGLLTEFVTWRAGFYIGAGMTSINVALVLWAVPKGSAEVAPWSEKRRRLLEDIDWVGAALASTSLAMSSYVFATLTGSVRSIHQASTVVILVLSMALVPVFLMWVGRQEKNGRPAIIPNSLWRNRFFTTICLAVFLAWGVFNSVETILTFYFQDVQGLGPLQTSIRFLPAAASGMATNLIAGALVHRVPANVLVNIGLGATISAPLLMTFAGPSSPYWTTGFLANIFSPIACDILFTVANLLITSVFPAKTQALAGGVFNTVSQIGKSVGVALTAVVAASVTEQGPYDNKHSPDALMYGYKAAFWFCFSLCAVTVILSIWGLRGVGKIGHKRD